MGSYEFFKLVVPSVMAGLLAWLYASLTKVGKAEHEKAIAALEKLIEKQGERNSKFESALNDKVSRAELKESMTELKAMFTELKIEMREDFQQLRAELRKAS